jgi:hypothetical protein
MSHRTTSILGNSIPCARCGRLLTHLFVQNVRVDIVCTCGESLVVGTAMFANAKKATPDFRRDIGTREFAQYASRSRPPYFSDTIPEHDRY